ncbi:MAG: AAA family ATPase, partial [Hyphomonadaceae bacterium]
MTAYAAKAALSLGAGVVAVAVASAIAPPAVAAGATATALLGVVAGNALANVGAGVLGNSLHSGLQNGYDAVLQALTAASKTGRAPENHDLARAVRRAHLLALKVIVASHLQEARSGGEFDAPTVERFARVAVKWIHGQLKAAESTAFFDRHTIDVAAADLAPLVRDASVKADLQVLAALGRAAADAAFLELAEAIKPAVPVVPDSFRDRFEGCSGDGGWLAAAQAFFLHALKTDERVRTVVLFARLEGMEARSAATAAQVEVRLTEAVAEMRATSKLMEDRLALLANTTTEFSSWSDENRRGLLDAILPLLVDTNFVEAVRRRAGCARPDDFWAASRASRDVTDRVSNLLRVFFGREDDFERLNEFIDTNERAVIVVAGPAGAGKSALLARWIQRIEAVGDSAIVRHFVSNNYGATTDPIDALRHLLAQIREMDGYRAGPSAGTIPTDQRTLLDMLTARLAQPAPDGHKLLLVLDGLDELDAPLLDTFVRSDLGRGNYIVVSGRADVGALPIVLSPWLAMGLDDGSRPKRFDIAGLSRGDVAEWLSARISGLSIGELARLADDVYQSADGLAVFAYFLIDHLSSLEDGRAAVASVPPNFGTFVQDQLARLRSAVGRRWSPGVDALFSVLSICEGAIVEEELRSYFEFRGRADQRFPVFEGLHALDPRITRWLSIHGDFGGDGSSVSVAMYHPRLTAEFRRALGASATQAHVRLIDWMRENVPATGDGGACGYALRHLPKHLISTQRLSECGSLLEDVQFMEARFRAFGGAVAATAMREDWRRWTAAIMASGEHGAAEIANERAPHRRFWGNYTSALCRVAQSGERRNIDSLRGLLADVDLISGAARVLAPSRALLPHSLSLMEAHTDWVYGARVLHDGRILSWGQEGLLCLWSAQGEKLAVLEGHRSFVSGAEVFADGRILSWGHDRALRLWSRAGFPLAVLDGHDHGVRGACVLQSDHIASCGWDGTLRIWSGEGALLFVRDAHDGGAYGLARTTCGERIITWGKDRAIRLWSSGGELLQEFAGHSDVVVRARQLNDEHVLSWSEDGALMLWTISEGTRVAVFEGHKGAVADVLTLPDGRILSWGRDRTLRIWSAQGEPGPVLVGHNGWVEGALVLDADRILSWAHDIAPRIWSLSGESRAVLEGHMEHVTGATVLEDGEIVTSSWDGTLRTWSSEGRAKAIYEGHQDPVMGVIQVSDRAVLSWSRDGSLRTWSNSRLDAGETDEHHRHAINGFERLRDGRILSWSADSTIRFWSATGAALMVIDTCDEVAFARALSGGRLFSSGARLARLWSAEGQLLRTLDGHEGLVWGGLELSNGRILSWDAVGHLGFWSSEGDAIRMTHNHFGTIFGVREISDGGLISWSSDCIRKWSPEGEALTVAFDHDNASISGVHVLPDDRILAWGWGNKIWLFDGSGARTKVCEGHASFVKGALILRNGQVLSWSDDGTLRFWNETGVCVQTIEAHAKGVIGAVPLDDGGILSWGKDRTVRRWSSTGN